jgi:hypothetical protein
MALSFMAQRVVSWPAIVDGQFVKEGFCHLGNDRRPTYQEMRVHDVEVAKVLLDQRL